ncbi:MULTISPECIES: hypothetical protein [unclassified Saccharicrinis]|uniref:hypothetical protein n=1 Tax=unclassified Saccharicrinis TaxID=2646859 RepID=UPI003D33E8C3
MNKVMVYFICLLPLILSSLSCVNTDEFNLPYEVVIKNGQVHHNQVNNFRLQMIKVVSDSRCPTGVECVWEGDAAILFDLEIKDHQNFILHTHAGFQTDTIIDTIKFVLLECNPAPVYGEDIKPEDYAVKLRIEEVN